MGIKLAQINECTCERCGKVWESKIIPKQCPKCRSPYWRFKRGELPRGYPSKDRDQLGRFVTAGRKATTAK